MPSRVSAAKLNCLFCFLTGKIGEPVTLDRQVVGLSDQRHSSHKWLERSYKYLFMASGSNLQNPFLRKLAQPNYWLVGYDLSDFTPWTK